MPANLMAVEDAKAIILSKISTLEKENIALSDALGRILADDIHAVISHPAHPISAMDGYALYIDGEQLEAGTRLDVIGEAAAGHPFSHPLQKGQAVRIFTGAYLPENSHGILIQEDALHENGKVTLKQTVKKGQFVRPMGLDFAAGDKLISKGQALHARAFALAALSGNQHCLVRKIPKIAILSSGDELVPFGQTPQPGQLVNSNSLYLKSLVEASGAYAVDCGIIPDRKGALLASIQKAISVHGEFDLIISSGGASVGNHDHIFSDLQESTTAEVNFWKIAMRPGKPLMCATIANTPFIGLPGNPVSAGVCALVFILPALHKMLSLAPETTAQSAIVTTSLPENDKRQDYLRATLVIDSQGNRQITPMSKQDSSMLSCFTQANALIIRPPYAAEALPGDEVEILTMPSGI